MDRLDQFQLVQLVHLVQLDKILITQEVYAGPLICCDTKNLTTFIQNMSSQKSFSLDSLASLTNCKLIGNPQHVITGVADLETATFHDASFFSNPRYQQAMKNSNAGVIFVDSHTPLLDGKNYLISDQPSRCFQQLVDVLHPPRQHPSGFKGIHPTVVIHETAQLGEGVFGWSPRSIGRRC